MRGSILFRYPMLIFNGNRPLMQHIFPDLDDDLKAGDKSLDDILPRGNIQPNPPCSFGSFSSSSVTRDSNGVS